jgi:8-oxo-dGTP pyrophosphatase MutT (NUDIX family)
MYIIGRMRNATKQLKRKRVQYGALPYRRGERARPEVMLVTSRERRRWIIPKGWPKKGKSARRSAAREAFEEAGVIGSVARQAVGSFSYEKELRNGRTVTCKVRVFPLQVKRQTQEWPEKAERRVKWLPAKKAAKQVNEPELGEIIRRLAREI